MVLGSLGGYVPTVKRMLMTPGVLLVLLDRGASSTRVLLFGGDAPSALPWSAERDGVTQWELAEALCEENWANEVSRLYASSLRFERADVWLGVFVGFLDGSASDAPLPPWAAWHDLRRPPPELSRAWVALLESVRAEFVARSPDEAMRVH